MNRILTNEADIEKNWRKSAYDFFTRRLVYHIAFWAVFLACLTYLGWRNSGLTLGFVLGNELIDIVFYGTVIYFNLLYLIPNYLTKKRLWEYFGLLILSVIVITPLNVMALYLKFLGEPAFQLEVIKNQNGRFIFIFLVAGMSTIFKIITDWVRHQRERQELQTQTMQSELKFLKSQINPHFLFNTLNNLYALTLKKSDKAPEIVLKLSEMMRYMLYECNEKKVLLSKEVNYLTNYLDLERLRQGKNVEIDFELNGRVSNQKIAPLLFIPFVENSFKHGLSHLISRAYVFVRLDVFDDKIHIFIENSKPQQAPQKDPTRKSGGIGLVNVRRRLNILYPNQYELEIQNNPNNYIVDLVLDLEKGDY